MTEPKTTILLTIAAAFAGHMLVSVVSSHAAKTAQVDLPDKTVVEQKIDIADKTDKTAKMEKSFFGSRILKIRSQNGERPRLDLAFCIDTTGSMQGEIDTVKTKVKSMVAKLSSGQPKPIVRVGLVAYRDLGDDYVTKVFPFSENIDKVAKDILELQADGGGDGPEAVTEGIHSAINELDWDNSKHTAKLLYLIGDAAPHTGAGYLDMTGESKKANVKGICINTIACDGLDSLDNEGVPAFKRIASLTNGKFQPLSYQQDIVDASGKRTSIITSAGKTYELKSAGKDDWKVGADALVAHGAAAPILQGATNGTIGPQGGDCTVIQGVNTAGTVRANNNLENVMLEGAQDAMSKLMK